MNKTTTIVDGDEDLIEVTKSELAQKEKPKNNVSLNFNLTNRPQPPQNPQPATNPEETPLIDPSLYPSERTAKRRKKMFFGEDPKPYQQYQNQIRQMIT